MATIPLNGLQSIALLLRHRAKHILFQAFRKTQNRVEGRAQFMAHDRQKITFCPIRLFSIAGRLQSRFLASC